MCLWEVHFEPHMFMQQKSIHLYPSDVWFHTFDWVLSSEEQGVFVWIDTRPPLVMLLQGLLEEAPIDSTGPRFSAQNRPEVHANSFTIQIHLCNSFLYINVSYVFWDLISLRNNSEFCFYTDEWNDFARDGSKNINSQSLKSSLTMKKKGAGGGDNRAERRTQKAKNREGKKKKNERTHHARTHARTHAHKETDTHTHRETHTHTHRERRHTHTHRETTHTHTHR